MKIAVTSQNRKTVTEHAGMCRNFWVYDTGDKAIISKVLLELTKEESFRETDPDMQHKLDVVDVLITSGMGYGLKKRLNAKGIETVLTDIKSPDAAVEQYLHIT